MNLSSMAGRGAALQAAGQGIQQGGMGYLQLQQYLNELKMKTDAQGYQQQANMGMVNEMQRQPEYGPPDGSLTQQAMQMPTAQSGLLAGIAASQGRAIPQGATELIGAETKSSIAAQNSKDKALYRSYLYDSLNSKEGLAELQRTLAERGLSLKEADSKADIAYKQRMGDLKAAEMKLTRDMFSRGVTKDSLNAYKDLITNLEGQLDGTIREKDQALKNFETEQATLKDMQIGNLRMQLDEMREQYKAFAGKLTDGASGESGSVF